VHAAAAEFYHDRAMVSLCPLLIPHVIYFKPDRCHR